MSKSKIVCVAIYEFYGHTRYDIFYDGNKCRLSLEAEQLPKTAIEFMTTHEREDRESTTSPYKGKYFVYRRKSGE